MKSPQGLIKGIKKFRLATLRSVMGKDCLQVFNNLELSVEQKSSVKACLDALEAYFKPKRNVVYERYVFNSSSQQQEESTDEYVNRLRKYAASCNFGSLTHELIRDRLVLGIRDQATKLRLLKEEKLDLNKAVSMCRASEIASKQLKSMKNESEEEIKFARGQKYSARKPKPRDEKNVKGRKTSHPKSQTKPKCDAAVKVQYTSWRNVRLKEVSAGNARNLTIGRRNVSQSLKMYTLSKNLMDRWKDLTRKNRCSKWRRFPQCSHEVSACLHA